LFVVVVAYMVAAIGHGENPLIAIPAAVLIAALLWKGE
jgi:hypothetical protein